MSFNRINSGRSIPTSMSVATTVLDAAEVSIVSIQADLSRRGGSRRLPYSNGSVSIVSIQADLSRRESLLEPLLKVYRVSIVSIQADLSRRVAVWYITIVSVKCFNRINSGRSIPTRLFSWHWHDSGESVSIVSIQADLSRPLFLSGTEVTVNKTFQSYQFRQIYPDKRFGMLCIQVGFKTFQSYQFRQIYPDL